MEIIVQNNNFHIKTINTSYIFTVTAGGHLRHLYYGKKIQNPNFDIITEPFEFALGNSIVSNKEKLFLPENTLLDFAGCGKGDTREGCVIIENSDTSFVNEFLYKTHEIKNDVQQIDGMPYAKDNGIKSLSLIITLEDKLNNITINQYYKIMQDSDVITRFSEIINNGNEIFVHRLMSNMLDINSKDFTVNSLWGRWSNEANLACQTLENQIVIDSKCGTSSSRHNPFFFLKSSDEYIAFNLIYSGNHKAIIEKNSFGKTRVLQGMSDFNFRYPLQNGQKLVSPQAIMCYNKSEQEMQKNMHDFVNNHIVPNNFKEKPRPILINSWEATYFNFNESKLLKLAKEAKELGIELFVLDDGWFGQRNDDTSSLGDWHVNTKKLPNSINGLCDKINKMGMQFGIWIEPEMVNENSQLFKEHPEYAIKGNGDYNLGRNQLILDLSNKDVVQYLKTTFDDLLSSANITYVKWDMNRIFTDMQGKTLKNQGMFFYEYNKGLIELYTHLTTKFPDILFENCASGGNRFDLGMLCFSPQIWASDNTDGAERLKIQKNLLLGYPPSTIGAHVSDKINHQTLRKVPLASRFHISAFGVLGYELNLCDLPKDEKQEIKNQIVYYKKHRQTLQFGFTSAFTTGNVTQFNAIAKDGKTAIVMAMQSLSVPHSPTLTIKLPSGLIEKANYSIKSRVFDLSVKDFGSLINYISPVTIKQDGVLHNAVDKFYKMKSETHEFIATGEQLMNSGFYLPFAFCGTGYNDNVRFFPDFASRIYEINIIE